MARTDKPDILTLSGDQIDRIDQVLVAASHQIQVGQSQADDYRVEDALIEAEEAVDSARAKIADAVEAVRDDQEASGEAERERQTWHPAYHAA
jgi:hypothetical protein